MPGSLKRECARARKRERVLAVLLQVDSVGLWLSERVRERERGRKIERGRERMRERRSEKEREKETRKKTKRDRKREGTGFLIRWGSGWYSQQSLWDGYD